MNSSVSDNNEFAIVVDNLCKRFSSSYLGILKNSLLGINKQRKRDFTALENISFKVKKGEAVGIMGVNGSGKSTLLSIISGVLSPSSGTAKVNGKLSALLELGSGFNTDFTGRENIYLNASILGMSKIYLDEIIEQIIEFAEIGDFIDKPISTYSSGMTMRLAFSTQVFVEPSILIIDEALSVGDQYFRKKCLEKIYELIDKSLTLLIVSHNDETLRQITDRLLLINQGKLINDGKPDKIIEEYNKIIGLSKRTFTNKQILSFVRDGCTNGVSNYVETNTPKILTLKISGSMSSHQEMFYSGDKIILYISISNVIRNPFLNLGIRIRNRDGLKIYSWSTSNDKLVLSSSKCDVEVTLACDIGLGIYSIDVFLFEEKSGVSNNKKILDWVKNASFFKIKLRPNAVFGGISNLKAFSKIIIN